MADVHVPVGVEPDRFRIVVNRDASGRERAQRRGAGRHAPAEIGVRELTVRRVRHIPRLAADKVDARIEPIEIGNVHIARLEVDTAPGDQRANGVPATDGGVSPRRRPRDINGARVGRKSGVRSRHGQRIAVERPEPAVVGKRDVALEIEVLVVDLEQPAVNAGEDVALGPARHVPRERDGSAGCRGHGVQADASANIRRLHIVNGDVRAGYRLPGAGLGVFATLPVRRATGSDARLVFGIVAAAAVRRANQRFRALIATRTVTDAAARAGCALLQRAPHDIAHSRHRRGDRNRTRRGLIDQREHHRRHRRGVRHGNNVAFAAQERVAVTDAPAAPQRRVRIPQPDFNGVGAARPGRLRREVIHPEGENRVPPGIDQTRYNRNRGRKDCGFCETRPRREHVQHSVTAYGTGDSVNSSVACPYCPIKIGIDHEIVLRGN